MGDAPEGTHSTEEMEEFGKIINTPSLHTEKPNEKDERIRVLEEENKKLKENLKHKDQELADLSEKLASIQECMKAQMDEVSLAADKLNKKIKDVSNKILFKRMYEKQSTESSDRKKLHDELQKMLVLSEDIVVKNSEESTEETTGTCKSLGKALSKIMEMLEQTPKIANVCENISAQNNEFERQLQRITNEKWIGENPQINAFLGNYAYLDQWSFGYQIEIGFDIHTGFYYCSHAFHGSNTGWLPDGVERNGTRATIEGNILTITDTTDEKNTKDKSRSYELNEDGLKYNRDLYLRKQQDL